MSFTYGPAGTPDSHAHADRKSDGNANGKSNGDADTDSNRNNNTKRYAQADTDAKDCTDTEAAAHSAGAPLGCVGISEFMLWWQADI